MTTPKQVSTLLVALVIIAHAYGGTTAEAKKNNPRKHPNGSPPVTRKTHAILTINSFEKGGDGGGPSECDGKYHSNKTPIVALSTGWYDHGKRCHRFITINGNGKSVKAKVVDECDSNRGCRNDIVDGSVAVWEALGVPKKSRGWMKVTWSD